jgi:integrase/recombinase XerC
MRRIYVNALDRLIAHLAANGMPTAARSVKREHVESFVATRRATVKPTTLSVKFRALQQFWKWCVDEDEIDRSPMERMKAPTVAVVHGAQLSGARLGECASSAAAVSK